MLERASERSIPVLVIYRDAQMINVTLGGSLHADVYEAYDGAPRLRTPLPRKTIRLVQGRRLHGIIGKARDRVNALHHQSIDRLGDGLRVGARDEHDIVQAIEHPSASFLLGVQWHPEFMVFAPGQQRLYRALVEATRGHERAPRPLLLSATLDKAAQGQSV